LEELKMAIVRWRPGLGLNPQSHSPRFNPWGNLAESEAEKEKTMYNWEPFTNIVETQEHYKVSLELPGVKKEDVKITVVENTLVVNGEKKRDEEIDEKRYSRIERVFGAFERKIQFSSDVDVNKISATAKDGILMIEVGKKEESKPKEISIKVQ
jgi:HSP20 family protein